MSTAFDPFTATLDEAMAADRDAARGDGVGQPFVRWSTAQLLLAEREHFEANPLDGVHLCAQHALVMPDWLADAFSGAYLRVIHAEVATWDDAFGRPYAKRTRLEREREHRRLAPLVFKAVTDALLADPSRRLDDYLFDDVGKLDGIGIGKTQARELYTEACKRYGYGGAKTAAAIRRAAKHNDGDA